jgi:REase_DpnII-MboI
LLMESNCSEQFPLCGFSCMTRKAQHKSDARIGPMSLQTVASTLQKLDEEIFFAILDVAIDIDGELAVGDARQMFIQGTRTALRYPVLYPGHSVGAMYRYVALRSKGLQFLQKHGFIASFEFHKTGMSGFEGAFEVAVDDPYLFGEAMIELKAEQNRRDPGKEMESDIQSATARLMQLADSFHGVSLKLRNRRTGREPIVVNDEYDVQYVLAALLETRFEDVRPEEWTPSYAGGSNRVDFLLKKEAVLVETKMTRDGLTDRRLGDELIIDIAHYKQVMDCRALVCFVYDPGHRLSNPHGIENDLSRITDGLDVRVLIRPKS